MLLVNIHSGVRIPKAFLNIDADLNNSHYNNSVI